jgi:D-alanyl-D-alanine carboxypeptidase
LPLDRFVALALIACAATSAAEPAAKPFPKEVDAIATKVLADTAVPSASLAVVRNGKIVYLQAYGTARLDPKTPAKPQMRYSIGSISKQFTASAILMLVEDGKMSLEDPLAKYLPNLAQGKEITVREILAQVSGYPDYWPQDYVPAEMERPITADAILARWTPKLDFKPGDKWEYSNTNYVIAGLIAEKVAGEPLMQFLQRRIFQPLGMTSVVDIDRGPLGPEDAAGYRRYALGPSRPAPKEGKGWLFAMGELAMTAEDLAKWNISVMKRSVLSAKSYDQLERPFLLNDGDATHYGLGIGVTKVDDRRLLRHDGEVSGYTALSSIYPDDGVAIVVLTNEDAAGPTIEGIADKIAKRIFQTDTEERTAQARRIYTDLQHGKINRVFFSANANAYFSTEALGDFAHSLGKLGKLKAFEQTAKRNRGGMIYRGFEAVHAKAKLKISTYTLPDGKLEQFMVEPE